MTRDYYAFAESANAAERAGDAASALEYHRGVPMFRRSAHGVALAQLADHANEMTPWMWARWAAYQCTRVEDTGTATAAAGRVALECTVAAFHAEDMEHAYQTGGDPMRVIARVSGQSWAFHQICTYELHGLESFLEEMPTGRLAEECGLARTWIGARLGGYRLEPSDPGTLVVRDLASGESVELLDLGAAVHADEGRWLIGRLVPSGTTPALMFDTRPLAVDRRTAAAAARDQERGRWVAALVDAIEDGRVDPTVLCSEDRELVTDIAGLQLLERGTPARSLATAREALARGRDEVGRAAYRILRGAAEGTLGSDDDAAYVAAAVVHPHGYAEACRRLLRPEHRAAWEHWAGLVPDPARGRLRRLAESSGAAAA